MILLLYRYTYVSYLYTFTLFMHKYTSRLYQYTRLLCTTSKLCDTTLDCEPLPMNKVSQCVSSTLQQYSILSVARCGLSAIVVVHVRCVVLLSCVAPIASIAH